MINKNELIEETLTSAYYYGAVFSMSAILKELIPNKTCLTTEEIESVLKILYEWQERLQKQAMLK